MLRRIQSWWRTSRTPYRKTPLPGARAHLEPELLEDRSVPAANPFLVADLNPVASSAFNSVTSPEFTAVGSNLYFVANNVVNGTELWKTDGTAGGTALVKDLVPGPQDSTPQELTAFNSQLYFVSQNNLWKSDGTAAGTTALFGSSPAFGYVDLTVAGSNLYFIAYTPAAGYELWKSDGTAGGTALLKDLNPGSGSSNVDNLVAVGSTLYFTADDGANGIELWKSDGTTGGTVMVMDINPSGSSTPSFLTTYDGKLAFAADDGINGLEPWVSDGTSGGTTMLADIYASSFSSLNSVNTEFVAIGSTLFFTADDGTNGTELWKSTGSGASLVKDIYSGGGSSLLSNLTAVGSTLYFGAASGTDYVLWKSDGTDAGTIVHSTVSTDGSVDLGDRPRYSWTNLGSNLVFRARDVSGELEPHVTNVGGASMIKDIAPGLATSDPTYLTNFGGALYFLANDGTNGLELWKSDGTSGGTALLKDIASGTLSSSPSDLVSDGTNLYFVATDASQFERIFKVGPTDTVTLLSSPLNEYFTPENLTAVNNTVFFSAYDNVNGAELWKTDGTVAGTTLVKNINPDTLFAINSSVPERLTRSGNLLYFVASNGTNGRELWKSDGTEGGTVMVRDLAVGPSDAATIANLTAGASGSLYFTYDNGANGVELWKSDGTDIGTVRVSDINPGSASSFPQNLLFFNNDLYFVATNGATYNLYRYNGTAVTLVKAFGASPPSNLVAGSGYFVFSADDGTSGSELWKSDGTVGGTVRVKDINVGVVGSSPSQITRVGSRFAFVANDGANGQELWYTDGTSAGTVLARNIAPGSLSPSISNLTAVGNVLFFTATDSATGAELWRSEGTTLTTRLAGDIIAGVSGSSPGPMAAFNGHLYFAATSPSSGNELYKFAVSPPTLTVTTPVLNVPEMSPVANGGTYANTFNSDPVSLSVDIGTLNRTGTSSGTWSWTAPTGDGPQGPFTVTVTADDNNGGFTVATFTYALVDVAPTISTSGVAIVNLNATYTLGLGSIVEPAPDTVTSYTIRWGDGQTTTGSGAPPASLNHVYTTGPGPYTINVDLTDEDGAHLGAGSRSVTVNVPATSIAVTPSSVAENATNGTVVGTVSAIDPNGDANTFALVSDAGGRFSLVAGQIQVANGLLLNFESATSHIIRLQATDSGGLTFEQDVTISLTNVNETPTDIALAPNTIAENSASLTVGTLSTTDPDAGGSFGYTLVAGSGSSDNASFTIIGSELKAVASFNFEIKSSYSVRVRSTDQGGLSTEKAFVVTVTNVNETPTDVAISSASVAENQTTGTVVGTFTGTDPDASPTFGFSLVTGTGSDDNASFTIVGSQLQTAASFNFEAKSTYSIRVRVTDQGGLSFEKPLTISVTNVNETPTDLALTPASINENAGANAEVGTLVPTDPDAGGTFAYALVAGTGSDDNAAFAIAGNKLQAVGSFDFETKPTYTVRVRVTDQGGLSFEKALAIAVADVNEAPTDIALSPTSIDENRPIGSVVGSLTTTDPDVAASFTYSLVSGVGSTDNASFSISSNGLLSGAKFDFETKPSYAIRIRSTDQGGLSTEKAFTVTVNNLAESASLVARVAGTGDLWAARSTPTGVTTTFAGRWPVATVTDVLTADFDGDGLQDIAARDFVGGPWYVGISNGAGQFTVSLWGAWAPVEWVDARFGDLNGDGRADVIARYRPTGQWWAGISDGTKFVTQLWTTWNPAVSWIYANVGDLDGNGRADILARVSETGDWWATLTQTNGTFTTVKYGNWAAIPGVTWVDVQMGDLNGDGKADMIGRYQQAGQWWASLSTGTSFNTVLWSTWNPAVTWVDVKLGDLNGDGKQDLLARVLQTGEWWSATTNPSGIGSTIAKQAAWAPIAWADVHLADYNGDGTLDLMSREPGTGRWWIAYARPTGWTTAFYVGWSSAVQWVDPRGALFFI